MTLSTDIIPLYIRHAGRFDAARGRSLMERPYLELAASLVGAPASVLDIGCGAGDPIAKHFIERGDRVTGIDASPAMLALARSRWPDARWIDADMRTLALGERFDIVLAWDSFFHLTGDHQRRMFEIFAAHANPGAALVFTSGTSEGEAIGELFGDALYHASLSADEYRSRLAASGFNVIRHTVEDPNCGGHTVWVAQLLALRQTR